VVLCRRDGANPPRRGTLHPHGAEREVQRGDPEADNTVSPQWLSRHPEDDFNLDVACRVWNSERQFSDWEPLEARVNRAVLAFIMKPLMPPLSFDEGIPEGKEDDDDGERQEHTARPLRMLDTRLTCSGCGALGGVSCRQCEDVRHEVSSRVLACLHILSARGGGPINELSKVSCGRGPGLG
jgi:hypothetical protein